MKHGSTFLLKMTVILMGVPVFALCIFLVPEIGNLAAELFPNNTYIKYLVLINLYATAIPFYFALYKAFKLLHYIDMNKAFSELSIKALKHIKYCAITFGSLYTLGMPIFYLMAEVDDAPGIILIVLIIIFASIVIAAFAAVLQKLLKNAIDIKLENDLTV